MSDEDKFPQEVAAFKAYRENGSEIYGTPLDRVTDLDPVFYTDGHPYVDSVRIARYQLVSVEDVPCNTTPERRASWGERNGR